MGFLTDWITDWLKSLLIDGIMGNLGGLLASHLKERPLLLGVRAPLTKDLVRIGRCSLLWRHHPPARRAVARIEVQNIQRGSRNFLICAV